MVERKSPSPTFIQISSTYGITATITWVIRKVMRLFLQKMHNIWIQIFQLIFFKFSSASFKTNITIYIFIFYNFDFFCKEYLKNIHSVDWRWPKFGVLFSYTKINLQNQLFNNLICIILSFTKFVCWSIVFFFV